MDAPKPAMTTSAQPQAVQMSAYLLLSLSRKPELMERDDAGVMNPPARQSTQTHSDECQRKRGLAERLRGGGAGRVRAFSLPPILMSSSPAVFRTASWD